MDTLKALIATITKRTTPNQLGLIFIFFSTIIMVYPYVFPLDGYIPHSEDWLEDSGQMTWNLWFVTESLLDFKNPFVTDMVFYPMGTNLGTHTLVSGWFPVTMLVKLLTFGSDYYPIYAFNIVVLLSFLGCASFTFLGLRGLGFGFIPSMLPTFGYAFCGFYYWHWKHLNLMAVFMLPVLFYLGLRLWQKTTRGRAILFTAAFAWSVYLTELSAFMAIGTVLFFILALPFSASRKPLFKRIKTLGILNILLCVGIFAVMVSPFLYNYFSTAGNIELPAKKDFYNFSANLVSLVMPDRNIALYGSFFRPYSLLITTGQKGREVYLGFPIVLFFLIGFIGRRPAQFWIGLILALFFISLGLGPTLKILGTDTKIVMPYGMLMQIPPFVQNRCPLRIVVIGSFFLLPAVAYGLHRFENFIARIGPKWLAKGFVLAAFIWAVLEAHTVPENDRIIYKVNREALTDMVEGPAVATSFRPRGCNQAVFQTFHGQPTAGFCYARATQKQKAYTSQLRRGFHAGSERFEKVANEKGIKNVIVDSRMPYANIVPLRNTSLNIVEFVDHPEDALYEIGVEQIKQGRPNARKTVWHLQLGEKKEIPFDRDGTVSAVELLADAKVTFKVTLFVEKRQVSAFTLKPQGKHGGLKWRIHDFSQEEAPYADRIVIEPTGGPAPCDVAALVVATEDI